MTDPNPPLTAAEREDLKERGFTWDDDGTMRRPRLSPRRCSAPPATRVNDPTAMMKALLDAHDGDLARATVDWNEIERRSDEKLARDLEAARNWQPKRRVPEGSQFITAEMYDELLAKMNDQPTVGALRRQRCNDGAKGAAYGLAALEDEARAVASAPVGLRNQQLNKSAWSLGRLVLEGTLRADEVEAVLVPAALDAGLPQREAHATVRGALRRRGVR